MPLYLLFHEPVIQSRLASVTHSWHWSSPTFDWGRVVWIPKLKTWFAVFGCIKFELLTIHSLTIVISQFSQKNHWKNVMWICLLQDHHQKKLCFLAQFKPTYFFACFNNVQTRDLPLEPLAREHPHLLLLTVFYQFSTWRLPRAFNEVEFLSLV